MRYELTPIHDSRKSFYGKATIINENGTITLISYHIRVATIKDGKAVVLGTYSQTTNRHIKEFLKQQGFKADNTKQIIKDYKKKV